jgi:hypothetical protein
MSKRAARPGHVLGPARLRRAWHGMDRLRVVPGLPGVPDPRSRHGPIGIRAGQAVPLYWSAQWYKAGPGPKITENHIYNYITEFTTNTKDDTRNILLSCSCNAASLKNFLGKNSHLVRNPRKEKRVQPAQIYNVHSSIQQVTRDRDK